MSCRRRSVDVQEADSATRRAAAGHHAGRRRAGAQRARRDAARHHRHHAGAQSGGRAARGDCDPMTHNNIPSTVTAATSTVDFVRPRLDRRSSARVPAELAAEFESMLLVNVLRDMQSSGPVDPRRRPSGDTLRRRDVRPDAGRGAVALPVEGAGASASRSVCSARSTRSRASLTRRPLPHRLQRRRRCRRFHRPPGRLLRRRARNGVNALAGDPRQTRISRPYGLELMRLDAPSYGGSGARVGAASTTTARSRAATIRRSRTRFSAGPTARRSTPRARARKRSAAGCATTCRAPATMDSTCSTSRANRF